MRKARLDQKCLGTAAKFTRAWRAGQSRTRTGGVPPRSIQGASFAEPSTTLKRLISLVTQEVQQACKGGYGYSDSANNTDRILHFTCPCGPSRLRSPFDCGTEAASGFEECAIRRWVTATLPACAAHARTRARIASFQSAKAWKRRDEAPLATRGQLWKDLLESWSPTLRQVRRFCCMRIASFNTPCSHLVRTSGSSILQGSLTALSPTALYAENR